MGHGRSRALHGLATTEPITPPKSHSKAASQVPNHEKSDAAEVRHMNKINRKDESKYLYERRLRAPIESHSTPIQ